MLTTDPILYNDGYLKVDGIHNIYFHQYGNPQGIPVLTIHGGPGGQSKSKYAKLYNLEKYRIIMFDQRGCGKSLPFAEVTNNTTQDLVEDIEKLRKYLKIEKWHIHGPSWGSTLAVYYAQHYPERILKMLLRGIFLASKAEEDWLHKNGASMFYPEEWENLLSMLPKETHSNITNYLYDIAMSSDRALQEKFLPAFNKWEESLLTLEPVTSEEEINIDQEINGSKIMLHYIKNIFFLEDMELLREEMIHKIINIPIVILNGRYDMITPPISAWRLHKALPQSQLILVTLAGHHGKDGVLATEIQKYLDFENWV